MATVTINGNDYLTEEDGVTHLNVYSQAKTPLGRWLSNFEYTPLTLPEGNFAGLESYYHYLKIMQSLKIAKVSTTDLGYDIERELERLKETSGKNAQTKGRDIKQKLSTLGIRIQNRPLDEFNEAFEHALKLKLASNVSMNDELASYLEDGIPLVHYYVMSGRVPHYRKRFDWLCERIYAVV